MHLLKKQIITFIISTALVNAAVYQQWKANAINGQSIKMPAMMTLKSLLVPSPLECNIECVTNQNCSGFSVLTNADSKCMCRLLQRVSIANETNVDASPANYTTYIIERQDEPESTTTATSSKCSLASRTKTTSTPWYYRYRSVSQDDTTSTTSKTTLTTQTTQETSSPTTATTKSTTDYTESTVTYSPLVRRGVMPMNVSAIDDFDVNNYIAFTPCNETPFTVSIIKHNNTSIKLQELSGVTAFPNYTGNCVNAVFKLYGLFYLQNETGVWSSFDLKTNQNGLLSHGVLISSGLNNSRVQGKVVMATRISTDSILIRFANNTITCVHGSEIVCQNCTEPSKISLSSACLTIANSMMVNYTHYSLVQSMVGNDEKSLQLVNDDLIYDY